MQVRDAVEDDATAMAAIADAPRDVMRNLVHDRTVRVAEPDDVDVDPNADERSSSSPGSQARQDADADTDAAGDQLLGFVSFDARQDAVHVTQLDGTAEACELLLSEPVRFAEREAMLVELLVPEADDGVAEAARNQGFNDVGQGPRFEGVPTTRYRLEP